MPVGWRLRARPEDFVVDEVPLFEPSGEGGHTYVHVEKRLRTTEQVARWLARSAAVSPRDVGYAGRKDRVAVTRQWFSVPGLSPDVARSLADEGVRVLDAIPHGHKLRTGALRGNRFTLRVSEVSEAALAGAPARLEELVARGVPNRFGAQRFGRTGDNAEQARALLLPGARVRDRRQARFLISALQAEVFNRVLEARRGREGTLLAGDVAVVCASGGPFVVEDPARDQPRADAFEISPTGPIFGNRVIEPAGEVAAREKAALESRGICLTDLRPPRGIRLRGARRALRVRPDNAQMRDFPGGFWLEFELPPGSYATVLIRAVLGEEPEVGPQTIAGDMPL